MIPIRGQLLEPDLAQRSRDDAAGAVWAERRDAVSAEAIDLEKEGVNRARDAYNGPLVDVFRGATATKVLLVFIPAFRSPVVFQWIPQYKSRSSRILTPYLEYVTLRWKLRWC